MDKNYLQSKLKSTGKAYLYFFFFGAHFKHWLYVRTNIGIPFNFINGFPGKREDLNLAGITIKKFNIYKIIQSPLGNMKFFLIHFYFPNKNLDYYLL